MGFNPQWQRVCRCVSHRLWTCAHQRAYLWKAVALLVIYMRSDNVENIFSSCFCRWAAKIWRLISLRHGDRNIFCLVCSLRQLNSSLLLDERIAVASTQVLVLLSQQGKCEQFHPFLQGCIFHHAIGRGWNFAFCVQDSVGTLALTMYCVFPTVQSPGQFHLVHSHLWPSFMSQF